MASKYMQKFPVPEEFPDILHDFTREILRYEPRDIIAFGVKYFEALNKNEDPSLIQDLEKVEHAVTRTQQPPQTQPKVETKQKEQKKKEQQQIIKQEQEPQLIQQEIEQFQEKKENSVEKPLTRPESSQSKESKATSHKTEKQASQLYMSKLYSEIAQTSEIVQNTSEQKSQSIKSNSFKTFPSGTLDAHIHEFQTEDKFSDAERCYVLAFPTTNSQSIYKTQEISSTDNFVFDAECNFYFDNSQVDEEIDEPSIVFQVYLSGAVKQQLGQAIIPINQFINNTVKLQEFKLFNQAQQANAFIKLTLTWKQEKSISQEGQQQQQQEQQKEEKPEEKQQQVKEEEKKEEIKEEKKEEQKEEFKEELKEEEKKQEEGKMEEQEQKEEQEKKDEQEVIIQQEEQSQQEK